MARRKKRPWKSQETSTRSYADGKADAGANHGGSHDFPSCPRAGSCDLHTESSRLFPSWTPWLVTFLTLAYRVVHVTNPSNWWVLHPDEIYQSMEVDIPVIAEGLRLEVLAALGGAHWVRPITHHPQWGLNLDSAEFRASANANIINIFVSAN
ncbi:mannosyltransferase [Plakobranchus ocellatus]|uniref:Mannosyltransferase n=1 Tax=Plakobranchus ocellatus TaxID=259542 RepID=A0AAV4CTA0_9GAST|nr:mannosyltransferase [Plakobranchus ocellatus]